MGVSVGHVFLRSCRDYGERNFATYISNGKKRHLTYGETAIVCARLARGMAMQGLRRGDKLIWYSDDTLHSALLYSACSVAGVIPVPLSPSFSHKFLFGLMRKVGAKHLAVSSSTHQFEVQTASPLLFSISDTNVAGFKRLDDTRKLDQAEAMKELSALLQTQASDPFLINPTSGSTGEPKLPVRSHQLYLRFMHHTALNFGLHAEPQERFLMVAALTHAIGCSLLPSAISLGAELCIPSDIDTRVKLADVLSLDPTYLVMPPRILQSLLRQYDEQGGSGKPFGPGARVVVTSGAAVDKKLVDRVESFGIRFFQFYAATEASMTGIQGPEDRAQKGFNFIRIMSDIQTKISPEGELMIKTPGMMLGYLIDGKIESVIDADGYFTTGDQATLEGSYVQLLGRKGDPFNTPGGTNIMPARIENMVEGFKWAKQVFLVGDRLPFVTAIVALNKAAVSEHALVEETDGYLDPQKNLALYKAIATDLNAINSELEKIEKIKAFSLFNRDFDVKCYSYLSNSKIRRDRKVFYELYASRIQRPYQAESGKDDPSFLETNEK